VARTGLPGGTDRSLQCHTPAIRKWLTTGEQPQYKNLEAQIRNHKAEAETMNTISRKNTRTTAGILAAAALIALGGLGTAGAPHQKPTTPVAGTTAPAPGQAAPGDGFGWE
jgi:hypothetical protein